MVDEKTMYAIGIIIAMLAKDRAQAVDVTANNVIDLTPLLKKWEPGSIDNPILHKAGEVVTYSDEPWKCAQEHTHHGEPDWEPGVAASLWSPYHGTDADHVFPYKAPTGAHDAYQTGEWMIWTDGNKYKCIQDATVWTPEELPSAWEVLA